MADIFSGHHWLAADENSKNREIAAALFNFMRFYAEQREAVDNWRF